MPATPTYSRRRPEATALHRVVRENLLALYEAAEHGFSAPLPGFVRGELEAYVDCGILARVRARGLRGGKSGAVTAVQRVSSDFRLNPHFHTLALDGVYVEDASGELSFHPLACLDAEAPSPKSMTVLP